MSRQTNDPAHAATLLLLQILLQMARSLHTSNNRDGGARVLSRAKQLAAKEIAQLNRQINRIETEVQAVEKLYRRPILELPRDIMLWIFKHCFSESLLLVCRAWNEIAHSASTLWRDARFSDSMVKQKLGLLLKSAAFTGDSLTHVDMSGLRTLQQARCWLKLCLKSRKSLVDLTYDDSTLMSSLDTSSAQWKSARAGLEKTVQHLFTDSPRLERVALTLHNATLLAKSPLEKLVSFSGSPAHLDIKRLPARYHPPLGWLLEDFSSNVEHFNYAINSRDDQWANYIADYIVCRAPYLRTLDIESTEDPNPAENALRLQRFGEKARKFWNRRKDIVACPQLRSLRAPAALAAGISAPQLSSASLILTAWQDARGVLEFLRKCSSLESLILVADNGVHYSSDLCSQYPSLRVQHQRTPAANRP